MSKRTLTPEQVAAIAESVGLPGKAFAQIAKGESGYQVGAIGHDPGGTKGLGLWQITTKYNDDIIRKYGGRQKMLTDPIANAKAAKEIYDRQGIGAWYGTKYLTDPKAHYKGDIAKALKGITGNSPYTASASSVTTPASSKTSEITVGGDVTVPHLPERERPSISAPPLPDYVRDAVPTLPSTDRSAPQKGIRDAVAALGAVPQSTIAETVNTPARTTTTGTTSSAPSGKSGIHGSKVLELIYNDGGKGFGIKDGQTVQGSQVFSGVWGGHANHVHVAAGPKTTVQLGKAAQRMGLNVGENPAFGGVDPGAHVPGSYHNKAEAIDVSAPMTPQGKALMKKFAKYVADYNNTRR